MSRIASCTQETEKIVFVSILVQVWQFVNFMILNTSCMHVHNWSRPVAPLWVTCLYQPAEKTLDMSLLAYYLYYLLNFSFITLLMK